MQRRKRHDVATVIRGGARWSAEDAQRILDEWARSGETLYGFAQRHGIVPQRMSWWRKRLGGERERRVADGATIAVAAPFLPVMVRAAEEERVLATVEIAGGLRVDLRALDRASAAWIAQLVKVLRDAS